MALDIMYIKVQNKTYGANEADLVNGATLTAYSIITNVGGDLGEDIFTVNSESAEEVELQITYINGDDYRLLQFQINDGDEQTLLAENTGGWTP